MRTKEILLRLNEIGNATHLSAAESKGLRQKTRETVDTLARLDMAGPIKSLNVSNAAAFSLYASQKVLG